MANNYDLWFHAAELFVMIAGVAAPMVWSTLRISSLLKDFPPHRHIDHRIIYPAGYAPPKSEESR